MARVLIDPIDATHADCLRAREWVRRQVDTMRDRASAWRPRPMPAGWR